MKNKSIKVLKIQLQEGRGSIDHHLDCLLGYSQNIVENMIHI